MIDPDVLFAGVVGLYWGVVTSAANHIRRKTGEGAVTWTVQLLAAVGPLCLMTVAAHTANLLLDTSAAFICYAIGLGLPLAISSARRRTARS